MCSIRRSLLSGAVSLMPTTRCLDLCKPVSMKSNGVRAGREYGWSKPHWAGTRGRLAQLTAQSWQPKDAYETSKRQHPTSREDPSTRIHTYKTSKDQHPTFKEHPS